jgi:hypothetical protein
VSWMRVDEDVLNDPAVAQATSERGPLGPASYLFALTTAKRQNKRGLVALSPIVLGRECGVTAEQASGAITTLVTVGLIAITADDGVYQVPNWPRFQPDPRPAGYERGSRSLPDAPREAQGETGQRDVTGRDGEKTNSAPASAPRRGGARAQSRAASEKRKAVMRGEA